MRMTRLRWLRHVLFVALACIVTAHVTTPAAEQSSQEETAAASDANQPETPETKPSSPAVSPPTTIPDQPSVAPQRVPAASVTSGLLPEGAAETAPSGSPAAGDSALELILRDSSSPATPDAASSQMSPGPPAGASGSEPLAPIPDSHEFGPVQIETASFNGITPGVSTLSEVQKAWGTSRKIAKRDGALIHLYSVEPFDQVEVSFADDTVISVVIRLDRSFPAKLVAEQLKLSDVRPVLVSNVMGEILGQSFPERGVLFAFAPSDDPSKLSMEVQQIVLEPVTAEPFLLRAETYLDTELELSVADLEQAIKLDPQNARAYWLQARALTALGDDQRGMAASAKAVTLKPEDPQYHLTRAQILGQAERFTDAVAEAKKALALGGKRPHVQAQALCLLGNIFGSGPRPDYEQAMDYHMQAIGAAKPLLDNQHPAIRMAAAETLIDAHLGAAHDIAWGNWNQKDVAVPKWLNRAAELAEELSENETWTEKQQFRIAVRAMAAYVGAEGQLDPTVWTEKTIRAADKEIAAARNSVAGRQVLWELGTALYDAVQIYQLRGEFEVALKCGQQAVECIEHIVQQQDNNPADNYLLGRLYFRLGAIEAINNQDHQSAVAWFEKANAALEKSMPAVGPGELGRLGETLVSMGVSYWETGQHKKAFELTTRGHGLIGRAVQNGMLEKSALDVPSRNLASMQRTMGADDQADEPEQNAGTTKDTILR